MLTSCPNRAYGNSRAKARLLFFLQQSGFSRSIAKELEFQRVRRTFPTALLSNILGILLGDNLRGFSLWRKPGHLWQCRVVSISAQSNLPAGERMATGILVADTGGVTNSRVSRQPRLRLDPDSDQRLCQQVLQRDSWRCQRCGISRYLQVHHIQLRSLLWRCGRKSHNHLQCLPSRNPSRCPSSLNLEHRRTAKLTHVRATCNKMPALARSVFELAMGIIFQCGVCLTTRVLAMWSGEFR